MEKMINMEGLGMTYQTPEKLVETTEQVESGYKLHILEHDNPAYKEIEIDFKNASLRVIKVEKLINNHLCQRYLSERKLLVYQRATIDPNFNLNEKYLYHGTQAQKANLCEEGLDSRIAKQGCFGKGIYFSDYPKKCTKYAEKGGGDENFILLMRVILGESKEYLKGVKDKTLVREPEKQPPYKGNRFYDSVKGCPVNHQEFVVYDSRRALIEYIITYQREEIRSIGAVAQAGSKPVRKLTPRRHLDLSSDSDDSSSATHKQIDDSDTDISVNDDQDITGYSSDEETKTQRPFEDVKSVIKVKKHNQKEFMNERMAEFLQQTGEWKSEVISMYLLRSNMNVDEAVQLYNADVLKTRLPDKPKEPKKEIINYVEKSQYPKAGSKEWQTLKEEEKKCELETLIKEFLESTSLSEDHTEYAKQMLASTDNNIDLAVVTHYAKM